MSIKILSYLTGDGYQARATRSTAMTLLTIGGNNFLRLASNLVLTRLLFPEAFGLMALVQVVIAGAIMFSDFGFRGAIVQDPRGNEPEFLNTAWTMQVARGVLLMALIMIFAGPAARFYDEPLLGSLLMVAAFVPFIKGFESTRMFTADRNLKIGRATAVTLGAQFVGIVATVTLAWWFRSVWALSFGSLVTPLFMVGLSHTILPGHPNRLRLERASVVSLFRYGGFIFIASLAGFFANHGDRAILGKFVALDDLAIYNIAMLLAVLPQRVSNAISNRVIFPLYARRPPAENPQNRRKINQARRLVTAPLILAGGAFAVIGDALVRLLYDVRYEAAGPYLVLIALSVFPQIIMQSYFRLPLASGHSGRYAAFQVISALIRVGLLLVLVPSYGLLGAVIAVPLASLTLYPAMLVMIRPYKSWDPLHDGFFFALSAALTVGVLWLNGDVVAPILAAL